MPVEREDDLPVTSALFVSECPLSALALCHWRSDPLGTEDAAREALRGHVFVHRHADLVEFAAAHTIDVIRYERSVTA